MLILFTPKHIIVTGGSICQGITYLYKAFMYPCCKGISKCFTKCVREEWQHLVRQLGQVF